jgi:hypothetical protein
MDKGNNICRRCNMKGHKEENCPQGNQAASFHARARAFEPDFDLLPVEASESFVDDLHTIDLLPSFWEMFKVFSFTHILSYIHNVARDFIKKQPSIDSHGFALARTLPLTAELCKSQASPALSEDMSIAFVAVGVLSKLMESKCKIMIKGKTGIFLCADILNKPGELRGNVTDDIDLLILAKQTSRRDASRKLFAQQIGAFIQACLQQKPSIVAMIKMHEMHPTHPMHQLDMMPVYKCSDVIVRGEGICGTGLESKNVKVTLDPGNGRKVKLVDITYTTYHKDIDRFYSRFSKADLGGLCYFYLDVRVAIMEYVFIILNNVKHCREFVAQTGSPRRKVEAVIPSSMRDADIKSRNVRFLAERAAMVDERRLPKARDFLDNLTDFEQATMFKFSKSAFMCASVIAEFPEYDSDGLDQEQRWSLQKRIVLMQLYELSRRRIIPRKFTSVMVETQDVLEEMLSEVILQKRDPERYGDKKMHQHMSERLKAVELLGKPRPEILFDKFRLSKVPGAIVAEDFEIDQFVDNPLESPMALPESEESEIESEDEKKSAAAAAFMRERKTRRNKHRFNKTVAKRVLLNKRFQDLHPEFAQQQRSSQVLPRLVDINSDSSGISSSDYSTTRSVQSTSSEGSTPKMYTPPESPSTPKGGYKSRKRRVYRKRYTMRKKAYKKRR